MENMSLFVPGSDHVWKVVYDQSCVVVSMFAPAFLWLTPFLVFVHPNTDWD